MVGRSRHRTAAGVLIIIGACFCFILWISYLVDLRNSYRILEHPEEYLVSGMFGILGFAFGLTAGINVLKRRSFPLVIIGITLIMVAGIFSFAEPAIGILIGIPMLVLTILGAWFTVISKREFTPMNMGEMWSKLRSRKDANLSRTILAWVFVSISVAILAWMTGVSTLHINPDEWGLFVPFSLFLAIPVCSLLAVIYGVRSRDWVGYTPAVIGTVILSSLIVFVVCSFLGSFLGLH